MKLSEDAKAIVAANLTAAYFQAPDPKNGESVPEELKMTKEKLVMNRFFDILRCLETYQSKGS